MVELAAPNAVTRAWGGGGGTGERASFRLRACSDHLRLNRDISPKMFYYISFLRPPPAQASTKSGGVAITPQVANDLRTEPYPGAVDIFYSWTPCGSPLAKPASVLTMQTTKPIKLTTWRQSNAYKELKVPLPPGVCSGSSWRLILSSTSSPGHHVIPLHGADVGSTPFPVVSLPIAFSASPLVKGDKHEEIERMFLVRTLGRDASLVIREQTSFDLDKVRCLVLISVALSLWKLNTNAVRRLLENLG